MIERKSLKEALEKADIPSGWEMDLVNNPPPSPDAIYKNGAWTRRVGVESASISCPEMTFAYQPKQQIPALSLNGSTIVYRGEVCTFMASPGVGKTTLTEGLVASFFAGKYGLTNVDSLGASFRPTGRKCLLADTERTEDDCSKTYHNIFRRLAKSERVLSEDKQRIADLTHIVMAEMGETEQLRRTLEQYIGTGEYELVILDGILDFCMSMLDDKDAMKVVRWIRALAVKHDCAIITTLHPNKGTDNPAGHIGAFLYRWSRAFLLIRNTSDKNVKEVTTDFQYAKLSHANLAGFEPVYFTWDNGVGMMTTCEAPAEPVYKVKLLKQAVMELRLQGMHEIPTSVLRDAYGNLAGVKPETAKKHIQSASKDGLLIMVGEGKSTRYLPSPDWNIDTIHSGTVAPYIYKGAIPESDSKDAKYPNSTRKEDVGYPKEWD